MRTALALSLTAGTALAAGAGVADTPVVVAPFEVLESHPLCAGPGRIAFRVAFDVKGAPARFGIAGQERAERCTIKTRRGAQVSEIPIPCPETEVAEVVATRTVDDMPLAADLSGEVVSCLAVNEITFVYGSWTLQTVTPLGIIAQKGDLATPGVTVVFQGPRSGPPEPTAMTSRAKPAALAFFWDGVDVPLQTKAGEPLEFSSYLVLSPTAPKSDDCGESGCTSTDISASWFARGFGGHRIGGLVDYVDGR